MYHIKSTDIARVNLLVLIKDIGTYVLDHSFFLEVSFSNSYISSFYKFRDYVYF